MVSETVGFIIQVITGLSGKAAKVSKIPVKIRIFY